MTSFDSCTLEDFISEATPQMGSLEEAASAMEITVQQLERYFNRLRVAVCADVNALQVTINNIVTVALPDLAAGVEVLSGRDVLGVASFVQLFDLGLFSAAVPSIASVAHGIARPFRAVSLYGAANAPGVTAAVSLPHVNQLGAGFDTNDIMLRVADPVIEARALIDISATFTQNHAIMEYVKV